MTRLTYVLFFLMLLALGVCLWLYNQSRHYSRTFNERVYTVNRVLHMLERMEALESMMRTTFHLHHGTHDSTHLFTELEKAQADSLLRELHQIVLYEEQRFRIDTLNSVFNENFLRLTASTTLPYNEETLRLIDRAKSFAKVKMAEQERQFHLHEERVTFWVNSILTLTGGLLLIGIGSTLYERRAKTKLKHLHESILIHAGVGVAVYTFPDETENSLVFSNNGATTKDGKQRIDLSQAPFANDELRSAFHNLRGGNDRFSTEFKYTDNENTYWFLVYLAPVTGNHVAFYYQDITKIKSVETELQKKVNQLEAVNKDLEQFAHATSHDLREPFRKIQLMADRLLQQANPTDIRYIDGIVRSAKKGSMLVEQILNYSKTQFDKTTPEHVDLNTLLRDVLDDFDLLIQEKRAEVNIGALPGVRGNKVQLNQLFANLISNALKFTSPERTPAIEVTYALESSEKKGDASSYHAISIRDNGIGFNPAYADQIFNAFERLNNYSEYAGFGLGLSLCKKIAMNHGGYIKATSVQGEGSTFAVYLPVAKDGIGG